jgi:hypothetical protein
VGRIEDGIRSKIIRLVVQDVPRAVVRELNHRRIREWKAEALHFHLDVRPPEVRRHVAAGLPARRLTLKEQVENHLGRWKPTRPDIRQDRLVEMGGEYIDRTAEGEPR